MSDNRPKSIVSLPPEPELRPSSVIGIDRIWLINLDRREDRLERFMRSHPAMNGRLNRLPAYDGKTLELTPALSRLFAPNNFHWHKPTIGCALSHLALWHRLALEKDDSAAWLILEDDAELDPTWVAAVEKAFIHDRVPPDWNILYLGGVLPRYRDFFERNILPLNRSIARVRPDCRFGENPQGYFHFCAYAYLLSARGARRLLELIRTWDGFWLQADFVAAYHTPDLSPPHPLYFFQPLLARSFQDSATGYAQPYGITKETSSKVDSDIWKDEDRFSEEDIASVSVSGRDLDVSAALGLTSPGKSVSSDVADGPSAPAGTSDQVHKAIKNPASPQSAKVGSPSRIKLFGLYSLRNIPNLEANHRDYAANNGLDYEKYEVSNPAEKWSLVHSLLESHEGETLAFIDAFSYFVSPGIADGIPEDLVIQEVNGRVMDNFFIVKSTPGTRGIFLNIRKKASTRSPGEKSSVFDVPLPEGTAKPYLHCLNDGLYFNVDLAFPSNALDVSNILVLGHKSSDWSTQSWSAAEILCHHRPVQKILYQAGQPFEVVNAGRPRALITLSCTEDGMPAPDYAMVSESNFRAYAEARDVTLYIYRGVPDVYAGLHSTWVKPYLVLRHLPSHEYVSWVDADVLISKRFILPEGDDVIVYRDPGDWLFNAGFMTFKNTEKAKAYLQAVIARCEALDDRSSLYVNGGDQTQFIEEFVIHFPDTAPLSNLSGNTPHFLDLAGEQSARLWHFMGLNPPPVRAIVMDYYRQFMLGDEPGRTTAFPRQNPVTSEGSRPVPSISGLQSLTRPMASSCIDKIWLINLERRPDRLEKFRENHPDIAGEILVLPAYDGKKLSLTPKLARLFAPNEFGWNKATMGCSLSHLELWHRLAEEPDENARYLIFEDDTRLSPRWRETVEEAFSRGDVPADWDVLYLGGILPKNEDVFETCKEQVSGRVNQVVPNGWFGQKPPNRYFHFGAFAYLLSRNGAKKLLEFIRLQNGIWPQADMLLGYVMPENYPIQVAHYFFDPLLAHCYQDVEAGFVKSYSDEKEEGKLDSDIWKEPSVFDENLARKMMSLAEPYDIPGALAEARAQANPYAHATTAKISLLHATRGRPSQALAARALWLGKARHPQRVEHLFSIDHDDESSEPLKIHPHVVQDRHGFSVGAWNLAASQTTGDILLQLSDDWLPPEGWDDLIAGRLDTAKEEVLWISDGHRQDDLMCMAILTRPYYEKHGLFDPAFRNVFSDNDFTTRAKGAGAVVDARDIFIEHRHPFAQPEETLDETYQRGNQPEEYARAQVIYEAKHSAQLGDVAGCNSLPADTVPGDGLIARSGAAVHLVEARPVKILTTFTNSHKSFFEEYFLPSFRKADKRREFSFLVSEMEQTCPDGKYGTRGFRETTADKLKIIIAAIEANKNRHIIYSDPDVQFFDGFAEDIFTYMDNNLDVDAFCQNDYPKHPTHVALCTGFMVLKCSDRLKKVFEKSLQNLDQFQHDQHAFNAFREDLKWRTLPENKYYTIAYNTGNVVWHGEKYDNIPNTILMHHANWVVGVESKKVLLDYINSRIVVHSSAN